MVNEWSVCQIEVSVGECHNYTVFMCKCVYACVCISLHKFYVLLCESAYVCMCICTLLCVFVLLCVCVCKRRKERERERNRLCEFVWKKAYPFVGVSVCVYANVCIYV